MQVRGVAALVGIGLVVAATLSETGCSVLLSTAEPTQCTSSRDCDAVASFRQRVCEDGFCVIPREDRDPVSEDAGSGCTSTTSCTAANSNKASVCKTAGGACVPWQTEQCPIITGAWDQPGVIVIGDIQPFHTRQADGRLATIPYAERIQRAIDLGVEEIATAVPGGIPSPGTTGRPIAVLHCDSEFDPAAAQAAMVHLTEVVGAQAVIVGGDVELAAVRAKAIEKQTALVCSDCIAPFPPGAAAWRIVPPLVQEAPMVAWRVKGIEAELKAGASPPATLKVAVLAVPEAAPSALVQALGTTLRFNDKSVVENGSSFALVTTENALTQSVNHLAHVQAITSFEPNVVIVAMGAEFPAHYLSAIETTWPAGKPKPRYVFTVLNYEVTPYVSLLSAGSAAAADLRSRISGTRPGFAQHLEDNIAGYSLRYRQANNFKAPDGNMSGYDAIYSLVYAFAAASTQPLLDGPHVSAGFERLRSGTTIDYGPAQAGLAIALLGQSTGSIDARGLLSDLDWDVPSRDLSTDVSMYCFQRSVDGELVLKPNAGPRLDRTTGLVTGTYACD